MLELLELPFDPAQAPFDSLPAVRDEVDQDGEIVDTLAALGVGFATQIADRVGEIRKDRDEQLKRCGIRMQDCELLGALLLARPDQRARSVRRFLGSVDVGFADVDCRPDRARQLVVERRECESLQDTQLRRSEIVERGENLFLDALADRLPREHADDSLDGDVRLLRDFDQDRHRRRVRDEGSRRHARLR